MPKLKKRSYSLVGLTGLLGFLGFRYFFTGEVSELFNFAFFAFFAFLIVGGTSNEVQDERWTQNAHKAGYWAFFVAIITVFAVGFLLANDLGNRELIILIAVFGWVASFYTYAFSFRAFEKA